MKMLCLLPVLSPVNLLNSGVCCNCILVYFWCNETGCSFSSYFSHHTRRCQSEMSPSESGSSISSIISSLFSLCGFEPEAVSSEVCADSCNMINKNRHQLKQGQTRKRLSLRRMQLAKGRKIWTIGQNCTGRNAETLPKLPDTLWSQKSNSLQTLNAGLNP